MLLAFSAVTFAVYTKGFSRVNREQELMYRILRDVLKSTVLWVSSLNSGQHNFYRNEITLQSTFNMGILDF